MTSYLSYVLFVLWQPEHDRGRLPGRRLAQFKRQRLISIEWCIFHHIHRALRIGSFVVSRARYDAIIQCENGADQFRSATSGAEIAEQALHRGYRHVTDRLLNSRRFRRIMFDRTEAMSVDVI